ncbi:MAG TPA: sulfurtransferase [Blastocatellia bacterium]|nr:sulfurtransferase [Blastocatellia bacterium]
MSTNRHRVLGYGSIVLMTALVLVGATLFLSGRDAESAGKDSSSMLVSTGWLGEHINDRGLVIISVGPRPSYDAGHIPGARFVEMSAIANSAPGSTLEMPPVDKLKTAFEDLGVSSDSRIVLCFLTNYVTPSTRVFFTLDYLGLGGQTSLLDGGLEAWRAEGRPVTTEAPQIKRGTITPHPRPELIVDAGWVSANMNKPKIAIVDARAPEFYTGASAGRMPRAGHIPSAVNLPFSTLADAANKLKDSPTLRQLFADAGIKQGDQIVSYCHIGQQATLVYFVAKYLGYDARLYDGSFEDWSKRSDLPVVATETKSTR